jgi:multidrug resistance protein, MATE family
MLVFSYSDGIAAFYTSLSDLIPEVS